MMNERFNTITTTNEYPLWLQLFDGKPVKLLVMVGVRDKINPGMTVQTFRRFAYGCSVLAAGIEWDKTNPKMQEVERRPDEWYQSPPGEARVSIWIKGQGVPVYTQSGIIWIAVNVFTELTSVIDFVTIMRMVAKERAEMLDIGNMQKPEPKEKSELDKAFPRDENGNPTGNSPAAPQNQQPVIAPSPPTKSVPDGAVDLGNYDYNQKASYESQYMGRIVCLNVSKVSRLIQAKKDGTGSYECLHVFGYYDGLPSETHPIYDFTAFIPKEGQNYGDWKTIMNSIGNDLNAPGAHYTHPMRFYYKITESKTDDRVFWNLRKIEILESPTQSQPPIQQTIPGTPRDEDIPF